MTINSNDTEVTLNATPTEAPPELPSQTTIPNAPFDLEQVYYRSQTFSSNSHNNPLVTAAAPLLTLANKLRDTQTYQDINKLHEHLTHEIKAFENKAQTLGCRTETMMAARYAVCSLIDEVILQTPWGNETIWGQYKMVPLFQNEDNADERFYVILNRLKTDAAIYIDILELMYLCLSLGFQGKYRYSDEAERRYELMESLYQTIRFHRGEFRKSLVNIEHSPSNTVSSSPTSHLSTKKALGISGMLLLLCFLGCSYVLSITAKPVYLGLQHIVKPTKITS